MWGERALGGRCRPLVERRRLEEQRRERRQELARVTRRELLVRLVHHRVKPRVGQGGEYVGDGEPLVSAGILGVGSL